MLTAETRNDKSGIEARAIDEKAKVPVNRWDVLLATIRDIERTQYEDAFGADTVSYGIEGWTINRRAGSLAEIQQKRLYVNQAIAEVAKPYLRAQRSLMR